MTHAAPSVVDVAVMPQTATAKAGGLLPLASNAVTSATNFAVTAGVMAAGGPEALGTFTLLISAYLMGVTLMRGLATQVLVADGRRLRDLAWPTLTVGVVAVLAGVAVSVLVRSSRSLWPVVAVLPLAVWQDVLRMYAFSRKAPGAALVSDSIWLVTVVAAMVVESMRGGGVTIVAIGWAMGAAFGLFFLLGWSVKRPRRDAASSPIHRTAYSTRVLLVENLGILLLGQALVYGLALVVNTEALGLFRFTQTLLVPAGLVSTALQVAILPSLRGEMLSRVEARRLFAIPFASGLALMMVIILLRTPLAEFLNYPANASLIAAYGLGVLALSISTVNAVRLAEIRREMSVQQWLPRRFLAAATEPTVGLISASALGVPGAMFGPVAQHSVMYLSIRKLVGPPS